MIISASEYLSKYKSLPRLHLSQCLWKAARNVQWESGALSLIIPVSLDCHMNKLASDKHIHKYGLPGKFLSENWSYGLIDPRLIIAQILQQGKEAMYGARRNLLQKHWITGISIGEHKSMGSSWVILITDKYDEKVLFNI